VLDLRNFIVISFLEIANRNFKLFNEFDEKQFGPRQRYINQNLKDFNNNLNNLNPKEKQYLLSAISFIIRDMFAGMTGKYSDNRNNLDIENISEQDTIENAKINWKKSDVNKSHFLFEFDEQDISIRAGDYLQISNSNNINSRIEKATVKEVNKNSMIVSFRNKLNDIDPNIEFYNIRKEESDSLLKKQIPLF
jgi:hypothetical protein